MQWRPSDVPNASWAGFLDGPLDASLLPDLPDLPEGPQEGADPSSAPATSKADAKLEKQRLKNRLAMRRAPLQPAPSPPLQAWLQQELPVPR